MADLFLLLVIYSFIGWTYESTLCSITNKKLINRGFLHGPLCPIYGFGSLALITFLYGYIEDPLQLFFAGAIITLSVEYFTGWLLETLFHKKWWDYSQRKFNIKGRICLIGAVVFGLMSVILITYVHPYVLTYTESIPFHSKQIIFGIFSIILLLDINLTVAKLIDKEQLRNNFHSKLEAIFER